ncbi:MAG: arsenite methyltransferase [Chloroflexi bacterium]|nr:arsenite methyltransferase [Chloroflexota bacterium]
MPDVTVPPEALREAVRAHYAARATAAQPGCGCGSPDALAIAGYSAAEIAVAPAAAHASLGCGNPTALTDLRPGEVVLDLGSGAGLDVLLSARRVGPTGFVYGLDMTPEMLALAERHRREQGATNVQFLQGYMEEIPLPDAAVDVVISNCVLNLAADKARVLREAYRVLRPGGRFAVSDIVVRGTLPEPVRASLAAWAGCVAGALTEDEYVRLLTAAGFEAPEVVVTHAFSAAEAQGQLGLPAAGAGEAWAIQSAFVRARKPAGVAG